VMEVILGKALWKRCFFCCCCSLVSGCGACWHPDPGNSRQPLRNHPSPWCAAISVVCTCLPATRSWGIKGLIATRPISSKQKV